MAQHIETKYCKQNKFRTIEAGIYKAFANPYIKGSVKFICDETGFYKEHENDEVYITTYAIPEGVVWGSNRGVFEIHFNKKKKLVEKIHLVA